MKEWTAVLLTKAYDELSTYAFAIWMRMMEMSAPQLESGRGRLAEVFGFSESRFNIIVRELVEKEYLSLDGKPGRPTRFFVLKRCRIATKSLFVSAA